MKREVTLGQPVVEARRDEELLGLVVVAERLVHANRRRVPLGLNRSEIDGEELFVTEIISHGPSLPVSSGNREHLSG